MEQRVKRLQSEYAWSENPPSRPRLHITSQQISEDGEEYNVTSSFLMTVVLGDDPDSDILSGERDDTFRRVDGDLKLAERTVYLDQVTLPVNLSFFL
jgi:3-phenylpropionate/cinnamic acid dioxygenase small subunit